MLQCSLNSWHQVTQHRLMPLVNLIHRNNDVTDGIEDQWSPWHFRLMDRPFTFRYILVLPKLR